MEKCSNCIIYWSSWRLIWNNEKLSAWRSDEASVQSWSSQCIEGLMKGGMCSAHMNMSIVVDYSVAFPSCSSAMSWITWLWLAALLAISPDVAHSLIVTPSTPFVVVIGTSVLTDVLKAIICWREWDQGGGHNELKFHLCFLFYFL